MNQSYKGVGTLPSIEITDTDFSYRGRQGEAVILLENIISFEVTTGTFTQFGYLTINENGNEHRVEFTSVHNKDMQKIQKMLGFQNESKPQSVKVLNPKKTIAEIEASMPESWKAKQAEKARVEQMKKDKIPFCPKCHSTSLTYKDKKLSVGRALVG